MRWPRDADGWPMRACSRIVSCRPHRWHVQVAGTGPDLILIHGAGAATQSWRGIFPRLTDTFRVIAVDLPGQGFTRMGDRRRCGLDETATDLLALAAHEGWEPCALIGHSAGGAIALRMAETARYPVLCINPALRNFDGVAGWLFPALARLLALNPLSAALFASTASRDRVRQLVQGTGSRLDPEGLALYHRLASDRSHVDATLTMMSRWSLDTLLPRLTSFDLPVRILVGRGDRAVPADSSHRACAQLPDCRLSEWDGFGHLIHEEAPERVADWIRETLDEVMQARA